MKLYEDHVLLAYAQRYSTGAWAPMRELLMGLYPSQAHANNAVYHLRRVVLEAGGEVKLKTPRLDSIFRTCGDVNGSEQINSNHQQGVNTMPNPTTNEMRMRRLNSAQAEEFIVPSFDLPFIIGALAMTLQNELRQPKPSHYILSVLSIYLANGLMRADPNDISVEMREAYTKLLCQCRAILRKEASNAL